MTGVARAGDSGMVHCSGYVIAGGSSDVFVNGRPAARVGDSSSVHLRPVGKKNVSLMWPLFLLVVPAYWSTEDPLPELAVHLLDVPL